MISLIIPCFNEEKNLDVIFSKCSKLKKLIKIEIIIVNNGSSDSSHDVINSKYKNNLNFKYVNIKKNKGYGNGIKQGLKVATGNYIGWTHADLQTDLLDLIKVENIIKFSKNKTSLFIKGNRKGRSFQENVFTFGMTIVESLIFMKKMNDIGAQPTIFSSSLLRRINFRHIPDDFSIDLFFYYLAKKSNYSVKRFEVHFPKRINGISSWNVNIFSKIIFILKMIKKSIQIRFNDLNKVYD